MSGERNKKPGNGSRKRNRREIQPPNLASIMWITASCLAITWACHISAMAMRLIEKMHSASVRPICVSEAGKRKTRRIQAMGAPKNDRFERTQWSVQSVGQLRERVLVPSLPFVIRHLLCFFLCEIRRRLRGVQSSAHFVLFLSNHLDACTAGAKGRL